MNKTNRKLRIFLAVIVVAYAFFFTSHLWFPDTEKLIAATQYYKKQTCGTYDMYITKWEYAAKDKRMEIIIELENKDVLDTDLQYEAVERNKGNLDIEKVVKKPEYIILAIDHIPDTWKEISLRIGTDKEQVKFYTNVEAVEQVKELPERTETGYEIERLQGQIAYDDFQIGNKTKEMKRLEKENTELEQKITEMKKEKYLSAEEADEAEDLIEKAESQLVLNLEEITTLQTEIGKIEARTANIEEQIQEIQ